MSDVVKATQLRPGMVVQHEGQLYTVFSVDHRTPSPAEWTATARLRPAAAPSEFSAQSISDE